MQKAVTFDMDGTLLDSDHARFLALKEALRLLGIDVKIEFEPYLEFFYSLGTWVQKLQEFLGVEKETSEKLHELWGELYEKAYWKHSKLFRGVREELLNIKKLGFKIGVISLGRSLEVLKQELEYFKLLDLVDSFYSLKFINSNFTEKRKKVVEIVLNNMECVPKLSVHVGDFETDIVVAKLLGMKSVSVKTGRGMFTDFDQLKPDFKIKHVGSGELVAWLKSTY